MALKTMISLVTIFQNVDENLQVLSPRANLGTNLAFLWSSRAIAAKGSRKTGAEDRPGEGKGRRGLEGH